MLIGVIAVGGIDYVVHRIPSNEMIADVEGETLFGDVEYLSSLIRINEDASPTRQEQTLVHELVHAMMFEAGIEEQDENLVNRLDKVFYQFLKQNTDFFERLDRPPKDSLGSEMNQIINWVERGDSK